MKRNRIPLLILLALCSSATLGMDSATSDPTSYGISANEQETTPSSNRIGAAARIGYVAGMQGIGLGAFYRLGDLELGPEYLEGQVEVNEVSSISSQFVHLLARYYLGESFNIHLGAGHRQISWDAVIVDNDTPSLISAKGRVDSWVITSGIGHTFTWDNGFFLGADWIGASIPLSSKETTESRTIVGDTTEKQVETADENEALGREIGKAISYTYLLVNAGFSF